MTEDTTILRLPIEDTCSHADCGKEAVTAFIVTGEYGTDCIAGYCKKHSDTFAGKSTNHTAIAEIEQ